MRKRTATLLVAGALMAGTGTFATASSEDLSPVTHVTVEAGDTLSAIAWQWGGTPEELAAVNGIPLNGIIEIGQVLVLPYPMEACIHEDGANQGTCYWDGDRRGNHAGGSVINY